MGTDGDSRRDPERLRDRLDAEADADDPRGGAIDGAAIMIAAAKASVPASLLPVLLDRAQGYLDTHADDYAREFECVHETDDTAVYFVPLGHWDTKGAELGFSHREVDAVRRAHTEHLRRIGTTADRRDEFETALEIREVAVVGADRPRQSAR
ncbi:hypothetical protein GJR98_05710 [Haloferax sp. MBLA0077]|uniref:DUF8048 domain-containing protein n=2 Tax=Haloferax TaxID=2251 RepID=A0A6G1Z0U4_9EURY|nr:hypothetical protein Hfx1149_05725 [Haloferax sp. CBA1149]MRW80209.1 hypothetical protein [Haloferax marinisediminis]